MVLIYFYYFLKPCCLVPINSCWNNSPNMYLNNRIVFLLITLVTFLNYLHFSISFILHHQLQTTFYQPILYHYLQLLIAPYMLSELLSHHHQEIFF